MHKIILENKHVTFLKAMLTLLYFCLNLEKTKKMLTSLPKGQLFITDSQLNHLSIISIII